MSEVAICNTGLSDLNLCTSPASAVVRHLPSGREFRRCEDCADRFAGLDTYEVVTHV